MLAALTSVLGPVPAVAVPAVGASGAVTVWPGTTPVTAAAGPVPAPFVAVTRTVYDWPLLSGLRVAVVAAAPVVCVLTAPVESLVAVTVYPVSAEPFSSGDCQLVTAEALPEVTVTLFGIEGAVAWVLLSTARYAACDGASSSRNSLPEPYWSLS